MTNERRARVEVLPVPKPNRGVSREQAFIARTSNVQATDEMQYSSDGVTGNVTHDRPGTVVMYKPSARMGFQARTVSASAVPMLFTQDWSDICPACQGHHLDRNGNPTTDPNACKAREPVNLRVCPVCRKRVYDSMQITEALMAESDDPNVITDESYGSSDPSTRTKQKMDLHLWVRHPEWAQANGVPPLPTAFKDMVETPTQRGT
jgi:hypothetical protein